MSELQKINLEKQWNLRAKIKHQQQVEHNCKKNKTIRLAYQYSDSGERKPRLLKDKKMEIRYRLYTFLYE